MYRIYPRWGSKTEKIMTPFSDELVDANRAQKGCGYGVFISVGLGDVEMAA